MTNNFGVEQVDTLTYDFTQWGGSEGTIPEPSSEQIEVFMETLRQVMPSKEITNKDGETETVIDVEKIAEAAQEGTDAEAVLNDAIGSLCSNHPAGHEISNLPFRVKRAFYGWIVGVFLGPEA